VTYSACPLFAFIAVLIVFYAPFLRGIFLVFFFGPLVFSILGLLNDSAAMGVLTTFPFPVGIYLSDGICRD